MAVKHAPRRPTLLEEDPVQDNEDMVRAAIEKADSDAEEATISIPNPTLDRILVQELEAPDKVGGIFLPPSARAAQAKQGRVLKGRVLAMGQGLILDNGDILDVFGLYGIRIGSIVTWNEYGGRTINEEHRLVIVSTQDTLCVENEYEEPEELEGEDEA